MLKVLLITFYKYWQIIKWNMIKLFNEFTEDNNKLQIWITQIQISRNLYNIFNKNFTSSKISYISYN